MNDCDLRKPGQDFCDHCPHRAVFDECRRDGVVPQSTISPPPSFQTRVGVLLLSALAFLVIPIAFRTMLRLKVENDVSDGVAAAVGAVLIIFMVVVGLAAGYGLYAALWSSSKKPRAA